MLLAVMNGWSFCTVENPCFKDFMSHVRPNFELPSMCCCCEQLLLLPKCSILCCYCFADTVSTSQVHTCCNNSTVAMELCSTSKVLELFSEHFEDRKEFVNNLLLNDKSSTTNNESCQSLT